MAVAVERTCPTREGQNNKQATTTKKDENRSKTEKKRKEGRCSAVPRKTHIVKRERETEEESRGTKKKHDTKKKWT